MDTIKDLERKVNIRKGKDSKMEEKISNVVEKISKMEDTCSKENKFLITSGNFENEEFKFSTKHTHTPKKKTR